MKHKVLLKKNRKVILETAARYGASNVRVFGSVVRGTDDEVSDIDFLVNLAPDRSLFDLGGLLYELRQILGVDVDVVTEDGLRARIRDNVLAEAVEL
jgi:predicted nucleotidyltransferase